MINFESEIIMTIKLLHLLFFYFFFNFLAICEIADGEITNKSTDKYGQDTLEVNLLLQMAENFEEDDILKTIEYVQKAIKLSERINYINGIIRSYGYRGVIESRLNNTPKSLETLLHAYKVGKDYKIYSYPLANTIVLIGNIYSNFYQKELALKCAEEAESMMGLIAPNILQLHVYTELSMLYVHLNSCKSANKIQLFIEQTFFANDYVSLHYKNYVLYLSKYYSAIGNNTNSLKYAIEAKNMFEGFDIAFSGIKILVYNNLGNVYFSCNNYDSAIFYYNKSLNLKLNINQNKWNAINSRDLGYAYLAKKDYETAQKYATNYLNLATANGYFEDTKRAYKLLFEINEKSKNYKCALFNLGKYSHINDSINNVEKSAIIMNVYFKNMIHGIESVNKDLLNENHKKEDEIKEKQTFEIFLNTVIVICLLFVIIIIIFFLINKKTTNKLKIQANEINQKNSQLTFQNQQLIILNEEVQGLIGIVSHDLKAPINRIDSLLNFVGLENENLSTNQSNYLRIAVQEVNNSKELIKNILDSEDQSAEYKVETELLPIFNYLSEFMQNYGIQCQNKAIKIITTIEKNNLLLPINKNYLARVVDNLLTNAIKFSNFGTNIYFSAQELPLHVLIIIKDEGPGMTSEDLKNIYKKYHKLSAKSTGGESSSGLGLYIVKQLIDKINGTIEVESTENKGTKFSIKIPKVEAN